MVELYMLLVEHTLRHINNILCKRYKNLKRKLQKEMKKNITIKQEKETKKLKLYTIFKQWKPKLLNKISKQFSQNPFQPN